MRAKPCGSGFPSKPRSTPRPKRRRPIDPRNRAFKSTLALVYLEKGEPRRALGVLTAAARLGGEESFEEYFLLGRAHAALGNREEALESFRSAQRLQPENHEVEDAIARLNAETK